MSTLPIETEALDSGQEDGSMTGVHFFTETDPTMESLHKGVSDQTTELEQDCNDDVSQYPVGSEANVTRSLEQDLRTKSPCKEVPVKHKVLIVYAHSERASFNGALLDTAVAALTEQGHEVTVSDLYMQRFNPLPSRADITDGALNPYHFNYPLEMGLAYGRGSLASDIAEEQAKLSRADTVIFQFPLHWASVPAILKGYFDRVLTIKFAFDVQDMFDKGKFRMKTAVLSIATGASESMFSTDGFMGDINIILWPIQNCILRFCGFNVLSPNICFAPSLATDAERTGMLAAWKDRLTRDIWKEPLIRFIPVDHFHPITGRLDGKILDKLLSTPATSADGETLRLPIGQHAGRQVTPDSMYIPEVSTMTQRCGAPETKAESRQSEG